MKVPVYGVVSVFPTLPTEVVPPGAGAERYAQTVRFGYGRERLRSARVNQRRRDDHRRPVRAARRTLANGRRPV